jgi:hypothetical protein
MSRVSAPNVPGPQPLLVPQGHVQRRDADVLVAEGRGDHLLTVRQAGGGAVAERGGPDIRVGMPGQRLGLGDGGEDVAHPQRAQCQVGVPWIPAGQRPAARGRVGAEPGEGPHPGLHLRYVRHRGVEAEPHPGRADRGREPEQLVVQDQRQDPVEGLRAPLVRGLQDSLAQTLLPLRGQQQAPGEVPALGPGGAEQADDHVVAHDPDRVLAGPHVHERGQGFLAAAPAEVDR